MILSIDIETFSSNDLLKGGVYKYVEAPDFEILLFAWSLNYGPVQIADLASGETLPENIMAMLTNPNVLKTAFNAQFERVCIQKHFKINLSVNQWDCTMVKAAMCGLPLSLKAVGAALKLDLQKDSAGTSLIKFFSIPCTPTSHNGMRKRNYPLHDFVRWQEFKSYCIRDVEVENAIRESLEFFDIPETEKRLYNLDQAVNDRGIKIDRQLVDNAIRIYSDFSESLMQEATELTGLNNPSSDTQLKQWIAETDGAVIDSLNKSAMPDVRSAITDESVHAVLDIREQLSKSSVKKYQAMEDCMTGDNRAHGLLQYYGANRTGRWSGRLVQIQNLPRIREKYIGLARDVVKTGDGDLLHLLYGNVPDILSQLIRTAFVASPGNRLIVADFSAIEARVIAWLAGEQWLLDVFTTHGKLYEATASQMFHVPLDDIKKDSPLRQKGKIAALALGYQGGAQALRCMGALQMGIPDDDLTAIVSSWRRANPAIVSLWHNVEEGAFNALGHPGYVIKVGKHIQFMHSGGILRASLPSGRALYYQGAMLQSSKYGGTSIAYYSMNQTTKKWGKTDTYGGKLAENIVQAIARDLLAESLLRLSDAGYNIVAHIHDEVIIDAPNSFGSLDDVINIMTQNPTWAEGLPLAADGFESEYYKK